MNSKKAGNVVVTMRLSQPDEVLFLMSFSCHLPTSSGPPQSDRECLFGDLSFHRCGCSGHYLINDPLPSHFVAPSLYGTGVSHWFVDQDGFITIQRVDRPKRKGKRRISDKGKGRKVADKSKVATK